MQCVFPACSPTMIVRTDGRRDSLWKAAGFLRSSATTLTAATQLCTTSRQVPTRLWLKQAQEPHLFEIKFGFYPMQDRIVDVTGILELQKLSARNAHHLEFQA